MTTVYNEPVHFAKGFTAAGDVGLPEASIGNQHIKEAAGIGGNKAIIRSRPQFRLGEIDTPAAAGEHRIFTCVTAASLRKFQVGLVSKCTSDATVTISLKLNGVAIPDSSVVFDSSDSDGADAKSSPVGITALAAGDYIDLVVVVDAGAGALGEGVFGVLEIDENPL